MFNTLRGRILVIIGAVLFTGYSLFSNGLTPGLDLKGGMHLALEVRDPEGAFTSEERSEMAQRAEEILRNRINEFGVEEPQILRTGSDRIIVQLPGIEDEERAKAVINRQAYLEFKMVQPLADLTPALERMDRLIASMLDTLDLGDLSPDTTQGGVAEQPPSGIDITDVLAGTTTRDSMAADSMAADSIASDSLAADSAAAAAAESALDTQAPLRSLLAQSPNGEGELWVLEQDVERVRRYLALPGVRDLLPRNTELRWAADPEGADAQLYRALYFLGRNPIITGEDLEDAQPGRDPQFNETIVTFQLSRRGGRVFGDSTGRHVGDRLAIVLDSLVHSAPVLQSRITTNGQIELGSAPITEANDLALVLRAGALPVQLDIVEQRSVGPTLGADSIAQGKIAGIIGIIAVVLIMMLYYKLSGVLAVLALCVYVVFVLGGLAGIGAALTAPGIAGLILSLGMAVDANVLIFERIREELAAGKSPRAASDAGFKAAMSAIVDSNITTLITALILYQVGTGPVRGFAVTLSIGILASFFSAVYVTRSFYLIYLERKRAATPISI